MDHMDHRDQMDANTGAFPAQPPQHSFTSAPTSAPMQSASFAQTPAACASCGAPIVGAAAFCPTCGRPLISSELAQPTTLAGVGSPGWYGASPDANAPTVAGLTTTPQSYPLAANTWPGAYPPAPTGIAALGSGAPVTPTALARPHPLRRFLAVVAAICVVALLAGGAYAVYAAFANTSQAAARILPDKTYVYASVDLTAAANNGHHVTLTDLAQTVGFASFVKAERLNWQTDVVPWVGRNIAVAAYPVTNQSATNVTTLGSTSGASATSASAAVASALNVGEALLMQSRNDSAAQAAMAKSAHAQSSSVKQFTYGGFTLYTVNTGTSAQFAASSPAFPGQTLTAGKGWAVIASSAAAAETIVDRLNGQGATLANAPAFQDATNNLPNSRFGTMYVNLREYYNSLVAIVPSAAQAALDFPLVDTYPVGGGYFTWTTTGLRAQLTFNAVKGVSIGAVGGNTTSLAALTPANATSYIGGANLGALTRAYLAQVPAALTATGSTKDPLQALFGVSSSDPALQQPFALISFPVGKTTASAYLLHAPNAAAAQTILQTVAKKNGWTLKPTTVDGLKATAISANSPSYTVTGSAPSGSMTGRPTDVITSQTTRTQVGVAAQVGQTFALVNSDNASAALGAIITASHSASASLSGSATFQALVSQAPGNAALTVYSDIAALRQANRQAGATTPQGLSGRVSAVLMTMVWNAQMNQTTLDIKLS